MPLASETIAAIATPPGEGGLGVIRISGPEAIDVAEKIFSGPVKSYKTHTAHLGKIHEDGDMIDEVLLLVMRCPRSYTGEDTIEIQCHGGALVTRQILELVLKVGAKPAGPGAFTMQAFLNGKMDLAQAEAVQSFIGAKNQLSLEAAGQQLSGKLSSHIDTLQKELIDTAAILEAWVDFPEEGLEFASKEEVINGLLMTLSKMEQLASTFHEGQKIQDGIKLALVGSPNAGKSSLMNALLGKDRAIVTPIAGTTRDLLEADLMLGGLHYHLVDTAGIRQTDALVEQEGIRRSYKALEEADLILLVIDTSHPLSQEDHELLQEVPPHKTLLIWNKIDLPHTVPSSTLPHQISLSAKTGERLTELRWLIEQIIWQGGPPSKEEVVLTNQRHKDSLSKAIGDLTTLIQGLESDISAELLSSDMRSCLSHLGAIMGLDISEEILGSIFSKFCVGK